MTTARRRARVEAARAPEPSGPVSLDWRHPDHGIVQWPPGPDAPVLLSVVCEARRRAREARERTLPGAPE